MSCERLSIEDLTALKNPWLVAEHVARYNFAARYAKGKVVIDAACGIGYGVDILIRKGKADKAFGFDVSWDALAQAYTHFASDRAMFQARDILDGFGETKCDLFVSLETIEHIPDTDKYLEVVKCSLNDDGLFIVSTPNRLISELERQLSNKPCNPYHVREWNTQEFMELLSLHFKRVVMYGQIFTPEPLWVKMLTKPFRSVIGEVQVRQAYGFFVPRRLDRVTLQPKYLLALCSTQQ